MKQKIHPDYVECTVTCGCGYSFKTRSTRPEMKVEICANCHPFFTGQQKFVDSAGRVERFTRKYGGNYFATSKKGGAKSGKA
jgi:large subunit ribosomal protein L31